MFAKCGFFLWIISSFRCSAINIGVLVNEAKFNSALIEERLQYQFKEANLTDQISAQIYAVNKLGCDCSLRLTIGNGLFNNSLIFAIVSDMKLSIYVSNLKQNQPLIIPINVSSKGFINQQLLMSVSQLILSNNDWIILVTNQTLSFCLDLHRIILKILCVDVTEISSNFDKIDEFMMQTVKGKLYKIMLVTDSKNISTQLFLSAKKNDLMTSLYQWILIGKSCDVWNHQQSMNLSVICNAENLISELSLANDIFQNTQRYLQNMDANFEFISTSSLILLQYGKCFNQSSFYLSKVFNNNAWLPVTNASCQAIVDMTTIRLCISLEEPFIYNVTSTDSETSQLGGYIIEVLKYIESRQPIKFQVYVRQNFSSCVYDIENQKSLVAIGRDFGVQYNLQSFYRSETIYWESIQIFAHKPENDSKLWNILRPLHYHVWLLCILSCLISAFTGVMLSKYSPLSAWNLGLDISIVDEVSFVENLWSYIGASLMQGQDFYPYSISSRVVLAIWWLFILVMSNVYSADLTSFLTISSGMKKLSTLDELLINPQYQLIAVENSRVHELLKTSNETKFKNMMSRIILEQNMEGCINKVLNSTNSACIGDASPLIRSATRNCSIVYMIDEYIDWQPLSFMFATNTSMKIILNNDITDISEIPIETLDFCRGAVEPEPSNEEFKNRKTIKMLIEIGLLDKWNTQYWQTGDPFDKPCNTDLVSSILGLADIGGAFILTAILFGLGTIILCIEFSVYYLVKRKVIKNCDDTISES